MSPAPERPDEAAVLRIEGEMTIYRAAELKALLLGQPPAADVDLTGVTEIDTAGVQLLIAARRRARAAGCGWRVRGSSSPVGETLRLLGLPELLQEAAAEVPR